MSERPADPNQRTGPIEPVDPARVEHTESTRIDSPGGTVERQETTYAAQPGAPVERIEYDSRVERTGVVGAERRQQRGILYGVLAGIVAVLLLGILVFALAG